MAKIKLTKNELKLQRDAMKRYERYLPTLQLKKQQLQLEVRHLREQMNGLLEEIARHDASMSAFLPLVAGNDGDGAGSLVTVKEWQVERRNIAGVDVPVFRSLQFEEPSYDLFSTPVWFDELVQLVRGRMELTLRHRLMEETLELLNQELRVVTQRVNLFEKVKIPEAKENIRKINIYIGDQQTNSVGRSKIAKGKCAKRDAETVF